MEEFTIFCKTLENLKMCKAYEKPYDLVVRTGIVQLFRICLGQACQAMKACLHEHGYEESKTGSPKMVIKVAYQAGMIHDDEKWLSALEARNEVAHSYNEEIALNIIRKTKADFIGLFEALKQELAEKWI
ncbi:HI0074 family nucleotidyltransferase substrate-binding subunit [uncultured Ruminococcus sp.]|uniref:HI0074 family nucleotidyltransferase substrate-binding subunit n=1 Tax=uncultured Ruminococcus sp. TaxID=165186 RepID=UPI002628E144|nr:HI0074 family nucleotidyltransferase substrate-binding subunit [uncultured Ruminococcus sp.]